MSVIVASSFGMVGDCRVSDDTGARYLPTAKVFKGFGLLVGAAGSLECVTRVKGLVAEGATTPESIAEVLDDSSEALLLASGKLLYITSDGGVQAVPSAFYGIGSGADAALGVLYGTGKCDLETMKCAVQFAFTRRIDCGDGITSFSS